MFRALHAAALTLPAVALVVSSGAAQLPSLPPASGSPQSAGAIGRTDAAPCRAASLGRDESIAVLCPDSVELATVHDLTDLLSSRIPGLMVQETGGVTGSAARIRLRGPGSIVLDNEPIFILDGVRIHSAPVEATILKLVPPSRIDDINVADIAVIEVLHGPATTAMYGTGAAAGVIRITTRHGGTGAPRWRAFAEAGPVMEVTRYPANYTQSGTRIADGTPMYQCSLDNRAIGLCVPDATSLASFNPLETASPFRRGLRQRYGADIGGAFGVLQFQMGAGRTREEGVVDANDLSRTNLRLNLGLTPVRDLVISLASAYLVGDAHFPAGPDHIESPLYGGLLGISSDDPIYRGYLIPRDSLQFLGWREDARRVDAAVSVRWTPLGWLDVSAGFGIDRTDVEDLERLSALILPEGELRRTEILEVDNQTATLEAAASWSSGGALRGRSSVGLERYESEFEQTVRFGTSGGVGRGSDREILGIHARQQLAWGDRLTMHAGLRRDEFRSGSGARPEPVSGSAGISWLARARPAQAPGAIGAIRVHLAYGRIDSPPAPFDLPPLGPIWPPPRDPDGDGGPPELERTAELEAGIASSLLRDRVQLALTGYRKVTTNGLMVIAGPTYVTNDATIRNTGIEAAITGRILDLRQAALGVELGVSRNSNKATALEGGPLSGGTGVGQQHSEGFPLGGYWRRPLLGYDDLNGDGIISRVNCPGSPAIVDGPACEIEVGQLQFVGSSIPKTEVFVAPKLTLLRRIEVSALLDYRGGFKQFNRTAMMRCAFERCRAVSDPGAPLAEQAQAIAAVMGADGAYVEDASFVKLRELAISIRAPRSWTSAAGGAPAKITLAGRNLATWTDYSGLDPEINTAGPRGFGQGEAFGQPPVRYYTARLSFGW